MGYNAYVISLIIVYVSSGALIGMFMYAQLTKRKLNQSKKFAQAAFIDALTGLGNRYKFNFVIADMVKHPEEKFALCFLDLDDFKHINDNMGHDAGDELLIELGKRLKSSLGDHGAVFRLGGDEYALIIVGVDNKLEVETIIKRVQRSVAMPILIRGNIVNLEYSLGISMFPEDSQDSVELVNFADTAMYHIKESGKSNYYFHNSALKARADSKRRMENELKAAYHNNEFGIDYQPIAGITDTNKIWLETFLYWQHPMIGKLRAEYFIKYAESIGLVTLIDEFVIKDSISHLRELKVKGYDNVCIAMNLSLRHFQRKDFIDKICDVLESYRVEPGTLMFEITDRIDVEKIENYKVMFDRLKKYGVYISANNLELRYEIMDLLKRLGIDQIKISSEYLVSNSIFKPVVIQDIVRLAKDMEYKVLVNRVESEERLKQVLKSPVDYVQGEYIHSIMEKSEVEQYINNYNKEMKTKVKKQLTK